MKSRETRPCRRDASAPSEDAGGTPALPVKKPMRQIHFRPRARRSRRGAGELVSPLAASVFAVSLLLSFWAPSAPAQTYITTVAGNGVAGFNGDGQPALRTSLYSPQDAVVGPDGNLYFTDWNNHRVRRLAGGTVVTVAGTGELGEARDGPADEIQFNQSSKRGGYAWIQQGRQG